MSLRERLSATNVYLILAGGSSFLLMLNFTINLVYQVETVGLNPLQLVLVGTLLELVCFLGEIPTGVVAVGTRVRLRDIDANETIEYHIVGSAEANPAEHKLSNESPVGKAIMGHKKGETVEVAAPRGSLKFKIMEIKAA